MKATAWSNYDPSGWTPEKMELTYNEQKYGNKFMNEWMKKLFNVFSHELIRSAFLFFPVC